ncbi:MAG: TraB family protein [Candidatus Methanofastidiosum methylothiophilum]|uniref:TraB family protein n=1 Tax=Candidatus Methanofastidiosum methylothiophilum TaxID=1705564 RepID=A0A150IP89_9EURY|nr:MAG: TraB family protein [Candidatus Methanofastidiosum methylthiophilus]KYC46859.1 MAG: TraB family protein [Candidatus Methanofastidiosum methylthiophilus]KYC49091.1 MAG: TraB family protein [Candidatus Methanofastidiosum methylthiophilus]
MAKETLKIGEKEVVLVGTVHISKESVDEVRAVIRKQKPDAVGVELCENRFEALKNVKKWEDTNILDIIKQGKIFLFLINLLLSNYQKRLGDKFGVKPGSEFVEAIKVAEEEKIKIVLIDRDIQTTLKRAWNKMKLKEKLKLMFGVFLGFFEEEEEEDIIEKLQDKDIVNELLNELSKEIPSVKETLIDERDRYIALKILQSDAKKFVAVIGRGHMEGVKRALNELNKKSIKKDLKELEVIPQKKSNLRYIGYLIPIIFFGIVIYGFFTKGLEFTLKVFLIWIIVNGTLSAIGAALAFAHPVSILVAFIAAPITSLNPTIAAGWFAGLAEIKFRKPKIKDFEGLNNINGLTDLWKNGVTRIILVVAFSNIGSTIGTIYAIPYIISLL